MTEQTKPKLTLSEKAVNWAKVLGIVLPLIGAGVVSVLGWYKSDDAQGDVTSLVKQLDKRVAKQESVINAQSEKLEKMLRRMIFFQAQQEGFRAGQLHAQNEQLEKQLAEWKAKKIPKTAATERIVEILKSTTTVPDRVPVQPAADESMQQQKTLPRIKSKAFKKAK